MSVYIYDGLGSVLAEVDPSGVVTAGRKYDVYGRVRTGQAGISEHKFVGKLGHMSEDETGLIYMRARYMDPVLGKFTSEDPAGDGNNWYVYCDNNPVNIIDLTGKFAGVAGEAEYDANVVIEAMGLKDIIAIIYGNKYIELIATMSVLLARKPDLREIDHILGQFGIKDKKTRRRLHDEISKRHYDLDEIREIAENLVSKPEKDNNDNNEDNGE